MQKDRSNILWEVLKINREIEDLKEDIKELYEEAKSISDPEDDKDKFWYLQAIRSYF